MRLIIVAAAVFFAWQMWSKPRHPTAKPSATAHIALPAGAPDKGYVKLGPEVDAAARQAVERYPELKDANSRLAKAFNLRLGRTFRDGGDRAFLEPSWPVTVAREEAEAVARGKFRAPFTAAINQSIGRAVRTYPDLGKNATPLQRAFEARCATLSAVELSRDDWPERIAAEEAGKLGAPSTGR